jgi:hypothetical protein
MWGGGKGGLNIAKYRLCDRMKETNSSLKLKKMKENSSSNPA